MSELIEYDSLEAVFDQYFNENAESFRMLFGNIEDLAEITECRIVVLPERMYDQFPAIIMLLDVHRQRIFDENLNESINTAIKRFSHLPNIVGYEDVDPEAFDVEYADGRVVSLFIVVRDLLSTFLKPFVSNIQNVRVTIGLHEEEPTVIA